MATGVAPYRLANAGLAALLAGLCWVTWKRAGGGAWDVFSVVLATSIIIANTLRRPPPSQSDNRPWVWGLCTVSLLYFLAFEDVSGNAEGAHSSLFYAIILFHILGDLCLIFLGRSFSILPARRGIKTQFLYRFVRHPVYALYLYADACFVFTATSLRNLAVFLVGALTFIVRAHLEERLLESDSEYLTYKGRTRYRFFPGIY